MPHRKLILDQIRQIVPEVLAKEVSHHQIDDDCRKAYQELLDLLQDHTLMEEMTNVRPS